MGAQRGYFLCLKTHSTLQMNPFSILAGMARWYFSFDRGETEAREGTSSECPRSKPGGKGRHRSYTSPTPVFRAPA